MHAPNTTVERLTRNDDSGAPSRWTVLAIVGIGVLMATLDSSIVNVSLPSIAAHFGVPLGPEVEWVIIAYLVVIAALLLSVGRLADLFGRRTIWASGLTIFTLGSAICGAAPSLGLLIGARALQAIGGAFIMAISPAMLTAAFPQEQRGRAIGLNAVVVSIGVSAGPPIGGIITEHFTWRWIFYINLPLGILGVIATLRMLPNDRRHGHPHFDPAGAALLAIALASLTAGLSVGNDAGWSSFMTVALCAVAVVSSVVFVLVERRHEHPVVDLSLFRNRIFSSATISVTLSFIATFAVSFLLPFYLEQLRGFDTEKTGLLLMPFPLALAFVAPFTGALADKVGTRWLAATGMTIAAAGLVLIARLDESTSLGFVVVALVIPPIGQATFQSLNNSALLGAAPKNRQGVASGMLATGRVVGQSLSVAIGGAIFSTLGRAEAGRVLASHHMSRALQGTFVHSFRAAMLACSATAVIAIFTSLVRGREH